MRGKGVENGGDRGGGEGNFWGMQHTYGQVVERGKAGQYVVGLFRTAQQQCIPLKQNTWSNRTTFSPAIS